MKKSLFLLVGLMLLSCKSTISNKKENEIINVSLIELISNSSKFENKIIRVKGYVKYKFENKAIYLSADDAKHLVLKNAIYIYLDENDFKENMIELPYEGYMSLVGVFNSQDLGHKSSFSGSLKNITFITKLESN